MILTRYQERILRPLAMVGAGPEYDADRMKHKFRKWILQYHPDKNPGATEEHALLANFGLHFRDLPMEPTATWLYLVAIEKALSKIDINNASYKGMLDVQRALKTMKMDFNSLKDDNLLPSDYMVAILKLEAGFREKLESREICLEHSGLFFIKYIDNCTECELERNVTLFDDELPDLDEWDPVKDVTIEVCSNNVDGEEGKKADKRQDKSEVPHVITIDCLNDDDEDEEEEEGEEIEDVRQYEQTHVDGLPVKDVSIEVCSGNVDGEEGKKADKRQDKSEKKLPHVITIDCLNDDDEDEEDEEGEEIEDVRQYEQTHVDGLPVKDVSIEVCSGNVDGEEGKKADKRQDKSEKKLRHVTIVDCLDDDNGDDDEEEGEEMEELGYFEQTHVDGSPVKDVTIEVCPDNVDGDEGKKADKRQDKSEKKLRHVTIIDCLADDNGDDDEEEEEEGEQKEEPGHFEQTHVDGSPVKDVTIEVCSDNVDGDEGKKADKRQDKSEKKLRHVTIVDCLDDDNGDDDEEEEREEMEEPGHFEHTHVDRSPGVSIEVCSGNVDGEEGKKADKRQDKSEKKLRHVTIVDCLDDDNGNDDEEEEEGEEMEEPDHLEQIHVDRSPGVTIEVCSGNVDGEEGKKADKRQDKSEKKQSQHRSTTKESHKYGVFLRDEKDKINLTHPNTDGTCKCLLCSDDCSYSIEKFNTHKKIHTHHFIEVGEFIVLLCKRSCRENPTPNYHYHCPYCNMTIIRKVDAKRHILSCHTKKNKTAARTKNTQKQRRVDHQQPDRSDSGITDTISSRTRDHCDDSEPAIDTTDKIPFANNQFNDSPHATNNTTAGNIKKPFIYSQNKLKRQRPRTTCPTCQKELFTWNLVNHIRRAHGKKSYQVTQETHLLSFHVDKEKGIFIVQGGTSGPSNPVHVQKDVIYNGPSSISCDGKICIQLSTMARSSMQPIFECKHLQSIIFCEQSAIIIQLDMANPPPSFLLPSTIEKIRSSLTEAAEAHTPLVCAVRFPHDHRRIYFSVYDSDTRHQYSLLHRVRITFEIDMHEWVCTCCRGNRRVQCLHKHIAKWACIIQFPELAPLKQINNGTGDDSPEFDDCDSRNTCQSTQDEATRDMERIFAYQLEYKGIPSTLPKHVLDISRKQIYPHDLVPTEQCCRYCGTTLESEDIVSRDAKIITKTSVICGLRTHQLQCPDCSLIYHYQEIKDGLHNFNNKVILSLELCIHIRAMLMSHTSASRVFTALEEELGTSLPQQSSLRNAYLHFEALCDHDYSFYCYICGYHPSKLCADLNKKTVFELIVNDIPDIPPDYDGTVDCEKFWQDIKTEMLSRAYITDSQFRLKPSFHYWAGWIGKHTRRERCLINTERDKLPHVKKSPAKSADELTDEFLIDLLLQKDEKVIRKVCKEMHVNQSGSKEDMVARLREAACLPDTYSKILTKIKAHNGGWLAFACEHGVVYAVKFVLRAEGSRDYADLLLSLKHFPNLVSCDLAPRIAVHTNLRSPENPAFSPYAGSFAESTDENIASAQAGTLIIHLPWLTTKKHPADDDGHPITGSNHHYCALDRLHENNYKSKVHKLRSLSLVPELAGRFNSQAVEQLNGEMGRNNYFLNMMTPTSQVFIFRLILHLRNQNLNRKYKRRIERTFPNQSVLFDELGRLIFSSSKPGDSPKQPGFASSAAGNSEDDGPVIDEKSYLDASVTASPGHHENTETFNTATDNEDVARGSHTSDTASPSAKAKHEIAYQKKLAERKWHTYDSKPPGLPSIPESVRERISNYCSVFDTTEVIQLNRYAIKRASLCTLKDNEWIDDQIINGFISLVISEYNVQLESGQKALLLDSFLLQTLQRGQPYVWYKQCVLAEYHYIIIPIYRPNHWCLMIVDSYDKVMTYIDPLQPGPVMPDFGLTAIRLFRQFATRRVSRINKPTEPTFRDYTMMSVEHDVQQDGDSCGVWILMFVEQLLNGTITPRQIHVPYFRWFVAYKIYALGKRKSEENRTVCDMACRITFCKKDKVGWIQCENAGCGRWAHKFCVDLTDNYDGVFICHICS